MKTLIQLAILLFITATSFAQLEWESKASIPSDGLHGGISFELGGMIYLGLGAQIDGSYSDKIYQYNLNENSWTMKNKFPGEGMFAPTCFKVQGDVFVCTGNKINTRINTTNQVYKYIQSTDTWLRMKDFPGSARFYSTSFVVDTLAYLGTGSGNNSIWTYDFWMYNPRTDNWTQLDNVPFSKSITVNAFTLNGIGYLGNRTDGTPTASNRYWQYDSQLDTWFTVPTMPGKRRTRVSSFKHDNKVYVGLGTDFIYPTPSYFNDFYQYDDQTNEWKHFTSNTGLTPREYAQIVTVDDNIFVIGGKDSTGILNDVWKLQKKSLSVKYSESIKNIITYPNPAKTQVTIDLVDFSQMSSYTLKVYNTLGVKVHSQVMSTSAYTISTRSLGGAGTYYLEIFDYTNNEIVRDVLIIQ
jgi:N-acetylneuraminic acid mutarotase